MLSAMPEKQNNRYPLIAAIAALVAAVALAVVIYLGWAAELWRAAVALLRAVGDSFLAAFRAAGERMAETAGAGVVSIGLWIAVVVAVAFWRRALLWRRWRLVVGSAALVVGIQGGLSFFEGELPLIGDAPLGGEWGDSIQGSSTILAYLRVGAIAVLGIAIISPVHTWRALRAAGRGTQRGAVASGRAYRAAPLHKPLGRGIAAGARGVAAPVHGMRARRSAAKDEALGRGVGEFLTSTSRPATDPLSRPPFSKGAKRPESAASSAPPEAPQGGRDMLGLVLSERAKNERLDQNLDDDPDQRLQEDILHILDKEPEDDVPDEEVDADDLEEESEGEESEDLEAVEEPPKAPKRRKPQWVLPSITLLAPPVAGKGVEEEHWATAALIEETLGQFGVEVSVSEIRPGPSVTMFGLVPGWNRRLRAGRAEMVGDAVGAAQNSDDRRSRVKVDSILAREKDLALALAAPSLRLQAPVPGEPVVGVEVPNRSSTLVTMRSVMETPEYKAMLAEDGLPVTLGLASAGEPVAVDLLKMPHLLIAGATGSGKSVCMNAIICSLIAHQTPAKVVVLLVDPKRVELTPYNGIPHLVTPVVTDPDKVVRLLRGAIEEMSRRYKLLEDAGVRNIQSYNRSPKATEHMPYFVICIDELADLMMTASFEVEQAICRLAQLGRATGIHMIVATQRPSVDVVTGLIKANFPSRIAFAVASQVDSRTIIDAAGADRLIGRGDMLFLSAASPKPRRVQGVLVTEEETYALAEHWQHHPPMDTTLPPIEDLARDAEEASAVREVVSGKKEGSLYDQALQVAAINRSLSTSLLQRKLGIGYPRAARLMDELETAGIVGPSGEAGKPREVVYLPDDIP